MDTRTIATAVLLMLMAGAGAAGYLFFRSRREDALQNLLGASRGAGLGKPSEERQRLRNDPTGAEFDRLKRETRARQAIKQEQAIEDKFFIAGIFSPQQKAEFARLRIVAPCVTTPALVYLCWGLTPILILLSAVVGLLAGFQLPFTLLDRRIQRRQEDIAFYLPLVIEQISIGVSSSLDIGPCLQRVVQMADERDSHNVVTELVKYTLNLIKTGVSLEDALTEVGKKSGQIELKHSFMALSQVAKHGGEISKQLQELADSVAAQREARIDGQIKKLELKATAPVALVFVGFLVIILTGFGLQIGAAFK